MKLGIGILCYKPNYFDRIKSWVPKLQNRDSIEVVLYHDNSKFSDEESKELTDLGIKIIEGGINKGMFLSRLSLAKYLSENSDMVLMCDDDDFCVPNVYEICNKYYPMNQTSCVYFRCIDLRSKDAIEGAKLGQNLNYLPKEQCYYMSNTLFNSKIFNLFINNVIENVDFVKSHFGTDRILAGEDEILRLMHSEFNRFLFGVNTKIISDDITELCDDTSKLGKYNITDHRYSSDKTEKEKEYELFWKKMDSLQQKYKELLNEKYNNQRFLGMLKD